MSVQSIDHELCHMKIEILFFDSCPNVEGARERVAFHLAELGMTAELEMIEVLNHDDAIAKRFLGSPSIRVDGLDIENEAQKDTEYSMRCRMYQTSSGLSGLPGKKQIVSALLSGGRSA